jgi:hypothetical protein
MMGVQVHSLRMPFIVLFAAQRGAGPEGIDRLARALGRTWIEAKQWTINASPRVIARVSDGVEAERCVRALREEGLDAESVDEAEVSASSAMQRPRVVRVLEGMIEADGQHLPYELVRALVRARLVTSVARSSVEVERVQAGRGTAVVSRQKTEHERVVEEALFVFGAHGERWLLVHSAIRYGALGVPLRPSQRENFELLLTMLRARVAAERFDDALRDGAAVSVDGVRITEVLVHALARRRGGLARPPMR